PSRRTACDGRRGGSPPPPAVIPVLVTGIQRPVCSGACGWLDTGDKPRYDKGSAYSSHDSSGMVGMADAGKIAQVSGEARAMKAAAGLYHAYFTGLILTLVTRRSARDAAEW